jgi:hypothetical protein
MRGKGRETRWLDRCTAVCLGGGYSGDVNASDALCLIRAVSWECGVYTISLLFRFFKGLYRVTSGVRVLKKLPGTRV